MSNIYENTNKKKVSDKKWVGSQTTCEQLKLLQMTQDTTDGLMTWQ